MKELVEEAEKAVRVMGASGGQRYRSVRNV